MWKEGPGLYLRGMFRFTSFSSRYSAGKQVPYVVKMNVCGLKQTTCYSVELFSVPSLWTVSCDSVVVLLPAAIKGLDLILRCAAMLAPPLHKRFNLQVLHHHHIGGAHDASLNYVIPRLDSKTQALDGVHERHSNNPNQQTTLFSMDPSPQTPIPC